MVADSVIFNSEFNLESFLKSIPSHLKLIPDHRPKGIEAIIRPKCQVLYFPLSEQADPTQSENVQRQTDVVDGVSPQGLSSDKDVADHCSKIDSDNSNQLLPKSVNSNTLASQKEDAGSPCSNIDTTPKCSAKVNNEGFSVEKVPPPKEHSADELKVVDSSKKLCQQAPLHIVWPHRWEHDKGPDSFFSALFALTEEGCHFKVSVIGEAFSEVPDVFQEAKARLQDKIVNWGYQTKQDYQSILDIADVVVSTAQHEFFGVSMLEAVSRGCYPLCPKRLVYPEIYPDECVYSTQAQLVKRLKRFCHYPKSARTDKFRHLTARFSWDLLRKDYKHLFTGDIPPQVL